MESITKRFTLGAPPAADIGRWRIRLAKADRLGARRHSLLKVSHGNKSGYFVGLGHEDGAGIVQVDYDVREHLGMGGKGSNADLKIELVTGWRSLCWYLQHRDPYIYVPAWLAAWSLSLGLVSILLGIIGAWPVIKDWFCG